MASAERVYWRRKLPHGFQFYLEALSRSLIRAHPVDMYEYAAVYLEGKMVERKGKAHIHKASNFKYFPSLFNRTNTGHY